MRSTTPTIRLVHRDALIRVWFAFFVYVACGLLLTANYSGRGLYFLVGTGLTILLTYWRNRLAGLAGFAVAATFIYFTVPRTFSLWSYWLGGRLSVDAYTFGVYVGASELILQQTASAFLAAALFYVHFSARHDLLRAFEATHTRPVPSKPVSGYYFVTQL